MSQLGSYEKAFSALFCYQMAAKISNRLAVSQWAGSGDSPNLFPLRRG
jgi:hypothetical protein